jgi:uncharacterized protein
MYSKAYIQYLVHFHSDRDYFECHELLEEFWKTTNEGKESIWVGFILLAVSNYHFRRGNINGAVRTLNKAISIFEDHLQNQSFGIDIECLVGQLKTRLTSMKNSESYTSFNLPIIDQSLLEECKRICQLKGYTWGQNSDLGDSNLIHRHFKRDRSDVILERQIASSKRHTNNRE